VLRNISIGWVATAAMIAATFILMPFVYGVLGEQGYGTWLLILAILGYLRQLLVGLPMASVKFMAEDVASGDTEELNRAVSTCAVLYLLMGAAAVVIGAGLFWFFVAAYDIPAEWRSGARIAFALMLLHTAISFSKMLPHALLAAHEDFVPRELVTLSITVLRIILTIEFLSREESLVALALVQLILLGCELILLVGLSRRRYPELRVDLRNFDRKLVRRMFSFSFYVMLMTTGGILAFQSDALIIGAWSDIAMIPLYVAPVSLLVYLFDFGDNLSQVVMPTTASLNTRGELTKLRDLYMRWSKIAFSLTLLAALYLLILGPRFLAWWIDPSFEVPAGRVLQILTIGTLFRLPLAAVGQSILMGMGLPRFPAIGVLVSSIANIILSILLVRPLGLVGVALGTLIPQQAFVVVLVLYTCRQLQVSTGSFLRYVLLRAAIGAIPSVAVLLWFAWALDVRGFLGLATAGFALVAVFALTWTFFVYRGDPYVDLRGWLVGLLARS